MTARRLSKADRQARILSDLRAAPTLRVADLAAELTVSTETVRRDLDELYERGLLERTYGGAVRPVATEPALAERHRLLAEERRAIARAVGGLLEPGQAIGLGAGSTTLHVAQFLAGHARDLTVVTHSFAAALELARNPSVRVLFCPGVVSAAEDCVTGTQAVEYLRTLHLNLAVLGASGLTEEGASEVHPDNAVLYRAMSQRAAQTVVVADHGKFNARGLTVYAAWARIAYLVTDRAPDGRLAAGIARGGAELLIAR
jgi:DeoR/GlpR family transcriptional regulator of sugar metabolism